MRPRAGDVGADLPALLREVDLDLEALRLVWSRREEGREILAFRGLQPRAGGEPRVVEGYLKRWEEGSRQEEVAAKWGRMRPVAAAGGPGVRELGAGRGLVFLFPNDAKLRGLRSLVQMDKLKRLDDGWARLGGGPWRVRARKSTSNLRRWKPEHRVVAELDLSLRCDEEGLSTRRRIFARLLPGRRAAELEARHEALVAAGLGDLIPKPLGTLLDGRIQLEEALDGRDLRADGVWDPGLARELAHSLRRFSRADAVGLPEAEGEAGLHDALKEIEGAFPALGTVLGSVSRGLSARRRGLTHGDLHPGQIILTAEGPRLVDLERVAIGDPLRDLGNLSAELRADALARPADAQRILDFREALLEESARSGLLDESARFAGEELRGMLLRLAVARRRGEAENEIGEGLAALLGASLGRGEAVLEPVDLRPRRRGAWSALALDPRGEELRGTWTPEDGVFRPARPEEDRGLPGLREALDRGPLVAWQPGRRAVLREDSDAGTHWIKVLPPRRVPRLASRMVALEAAVAAANGPAIPRLLSADEDSGLLVLADLPGVRLRDHRRGPRDLERVGRALAAWQGLGAPDGLEALRDESDEIAFWSSALARVRPDLAKRLQDAVADRFGGSPAPDSDRVLAHGDLHDKNVLLDVDGSVGFVDLDGVGLAPPARDLANLEAHLLFLRIERGEEAAAADDENAALRAGYLAAGGRAAPRATDRARAATLFRLACVHALRRDGARHFDPLLQEATSR